MTTAERPMGYPGKYRKYHFKSTCADSATFYNYFRMRLREGPFPKVDETDLHSIQTTPDRRLIHSPADLPRATWIGHATVLVQYRTVAFITDPHLSPHAGPTGFASPRRFTPPALAIKELPKIDFIVISHNHYDHLDRATVTMFSSDVLWYVPLGLKRWFLKRGFNSEKIIEMDWMQTHRFNRDVSVTLTPCVHWSKRTPWNTDSCLWGSWAVRIKDFNCWFGGDTGYDDAMFKSILLRQGPFDLAFIPIGAYGPRYFMGPQHVDPAQAVMIHRDIGSRRSVPIHWGTFQLTHEPFLEPPLLLAEAVADAGIYQEKFMPLKIGESVVVRG